MRDVMTLALREDVCQGKIALRRKGRVVRKIPQWLSFEGRRNFLLSLSSLALIVILLHQWCPVMELQFRKSWQERTSATPVTQREILKAQEQIDWGKLSEANFIGIEENIQGKICCSFCQDGDISAVSESCPPFVGWVRGCSVRSWTSLSHSANLVTLLPWDSRFLKSTRHQRCALLSPRCCSTCNSMGK